MDHIHVAYCTLMWISCKFHMRHISMQLNRSLSQVEYYTLSTAIIITTTTTIDCFVRFFLEKLPCTIILQYFLIFRMLGGVAGRHMSNRRKGSAIMRGGADDFSPSVRYARRRRAVTTMDHKTCALIQTRLKLGDIM